MNTKHHVVVTENDCVEACRGTEHYCVVALAIGRLIPEATRIEVNVDTIRFSIKDGDKTLRLAYRTPIQVRDYIREYDGGAVAKPFEFDIDRPEVAEKIPSPKGRARTPSFKPQGSPASRRSVRVLGEKSFA